MRLGVPAEKAGLIINVKKTKALRINTSTTDPFYS